MMRNQFTALAVFACCALTGLVMQAHAAGRATEGKVVAEINPLVLWHSTPAEKWTGALAIGNGRLGAMVFGGIDTDRLQLNDITVWSDGPSPNGDPADAYKALPEIRSLLAAGRYGEATSLVSGTFPSKAEYFPCYQTLGHLIFDYNLPEGTVTTYRRWLDIAKAVAGIEFSVDGATYTREVIASAPADVISMKMTCSKPAVLHFTIGLSREALA